MSANSWPDVVFFNEYIRFSSPGTQPAYGFLSP